MSALHRVLLAIAGVAAVVLLSWAAVSGPVGVPRLQTGGHAPRAEATATDDPTPTVAPGPTTGHRLPHASSPRFYLGPWLLAAAFAVVVVALLVRTAPVVAKRWRERVDGPLQAASALEVLPDDGDDLAAALAAGAGQQLAAVEEGTPRNGIVAAWGRLEDAASTSGLPRRSWETSAEFTARLLKGLDVDPVAAGRLASLYRTARFSSHELTESDRDDARDALRTLHADLGALR